MQLAHDQLSLKLYIVKCAGLVVPLYLILFLFFKMKESSSILEVHEIEYIVVHFLLMFGALILLRRVIYEASVWKVIFLGLVTGVTLAIIAFPLSMIIGLEDGIERFTNSYTMTGMVEVLVVLTFFALYGGFWLVGALSFWLAKRFAL